MKNENRYSGKLLSVYNKLKSIRIPGKVLFIIMGVASTIWFLVRVVPKPSRAAYPCMKTAAPIMSTFVIWLMANLGAFAAFKRSGKLWRNTRYVPAMTFVLMGLVLGTFATVQITGKLQAKSTADAQRAVFAPNAPIGTGQGIHPGRVVWVWDPAATETFTNGQETPFYLPEQWNQTVIGEMLDNSLKLLTREDTPADAWSSLFTYFNDKKGKGNVDYEAGETIFIKVNEGTSSWLADNNTLERDYTSWRANTAPITETTPGVTYAIIDNLVNVVGVAESDIWVADPRSHVWQHTYEYISADFPDVNFGDKGDYASLGRSELTMDPNVDLWFSDDGDEMNGAVSEHYFDQLVDADYLINLACLKAHARAGITLTAKNHFGSHTRESAAHMHPGLLSEENDIWNRLGYGKYRVQVDLMGSEVLGQNTLLFLVDGLFGSTEATDPPIPWVSSPFNNDWPNSILVSQDQVALESVSLDMLAKEASEGNAELWNDRPLKDGVDDYLQQAASSEYWPEGVTYDPEDDDSPLQSLGVHEHWNNSTEMKYSGNLGGEGITLVKFLDGEIVGLKEREIEPRSSFKVETFPNPVSESLNIRFNLLHESQVEIRIVDLSGKIVRTLDSEYMMAGQVTRAYELSGLDAGIYIYSVSVNNLGKTIVSSGKIQVR